VRLLGIAREKPCIKSEVSSASSFKDMFDRMPKIVGSRDLGHAHCQGSYLCACSASPIQSRLSNWKSLAQVVFEILRSKRIRVTSLTFQGHHSIAHIPFPIGSPLEPNLYLCFRDIQRQM